MALLLALLGGGPAGITINASITEANDTLAATVNDPIAITLAATEANDTLAATISHPVAVTAALNEGLETLAATVGVLVTVNASITEANDTLSADLTVAQAGGGINIDAALNEGLETLGATVGVTVGVNATLTEADDTLASTITVAQSGVNINAALNEGLETLDATIHVEQPVIIPSGGGGRWNPGSRDFDHTRTRSGRRRQTDELLCDQDIVLLLPLFELVHAGASQARIRIKANEIAWRAIRVGNVDELEKEIELARRCGPDWLITANAAARALNRILDDDAAAIALLLAS